MVPGFNILPNPLSPSPLWERELMVQALIFCPTRFSSLSCEERELTVPGFNFLPNPPFSLSPMGRGQGGGVKA